MSSQWGVLSLWCCVRVVGGFVVLVFVRFSINKSDNHLLNYVREKAKLLPHLKKKNLYMCSRDSDNRLLSSNHCADLSSSQVYLKSSIL
jgi:hypothetical protein